MLFCIIILQLSNSLNKFFLYWISFSFSIGTIENSSSYFVKPESKLAVGSFDGGGLNIGLIFFSTKS